MGTDTRRSSINIEEELLDNASEYDFYQAVRLLKRVQKDHKGRKTPKLHIRPELSLDFADSDLSEIEALDNHSSFSITTTFMGLYGVSSPLPAFFTEDLLDEEWDEQSNQREFLDIFHHQLYPLLYQAWYKYRFSHNAVEAQKEAYWQIIFSLFGLGSEEFLKSVDNPYVLMRYAGILMQQPKSPAGLETILRDYLEDTSIRIIPCVRRTVSINNDQRLHLSNQANVLGKDTVLGSEIDDLSGKFTIAIGPMSETVFHTYFGNHETISFIKKLSNFYLSLPLDADVKLIIEKNSAKPSTLGGEQWSSLGQNTWLLPESNDDILEISIPLNEFVPQSGPMTHSSLLGG